MAWRQQRRRRLLPLSLAAVLVALGGCQPAEDDPEFADARVFLESVFDKKVTTEVVDSFQDNAALLKWGISPQIQFPTPAGALPGNGRVVSTSPFVTIFEDFLTEDECEFLKMFAKRHLAPAMVVVSGDDWFGKQQETRSNEQHWLGPKDEQNVPVLRHIMKRFQRIARVPDEFVEAVQVGRYNISNKYEGHLDSDPASGVGRPATLITYLSDVESGGDTLFPVGRNDCGAYWHTDKESGEKTYGAQTCCNSPEKDTNQTVRVHPKRGRAVLFHNHFPDGVIDRRAHHIGCPVNEGVKWIAQRWFRFEPYNKISYHDDKGWDPRFDGAAVVPEERSTARNFRTISFTYPRVYQEENFLTPEETAALMAMAQARFESVSAGVAEVALGADEVAGDALLQELTKRALESVRLPPNVAKVKTVMTLKRLAAGGSEAPRMDSPLEDNETAQIATVAAYLRVPERGGALAFLHSVPSRNACAAADLEECCSRQDITKVQAHQGDAVVWFTYKQQGGLDNASTHALCPVHEGEVWILELGFRSKTPNIPQPDKKESSGEGPQPKLEFVNMEQDQLMIYWVPPHGGKEAYMETLPDGPLTKKTLDTFPGHTFAIRDAQGELVQKVTATAKSKQRAEISRKKSEL